jgi:gas vesicle protein
MSTQSNGFIKFSTGLLVGSLAGALAAVLTAPKSGKETRQQIRAKGLELRDSTEQTMEEALNTLKATAADVSTRADEFRTQSQAVMDESRKQWTEAAEEIKNVATEAIEEMSKTAAEAARGTGQAVPEHQT